MKKTELALTELGMIAGTRAMLGAGAGLLLGEKLSKESRRAVGWTLLLVGLASTVPLAINVFRNKE